MKLLTLAGLVVFQGWAIFATQSSAQAQTVSFNDGKAIIFNNMRLVLAHIYEIDLTPTKITICFQPDGKTCVTRDRPSPAANATPAANQPSFESIMSANWLDGVSSDSATLKFINPDMLNIGYCILDGAADSGTEEIYGLKGELLAKVAASLASNVACQDGDQWGPGAF